ncbi:hypothetical protein SteCoe_31961 [Stentor coeruleus]|uniref:Amidase domain-containing protein n=1 Tax=Stentor coeruleus TaxID=5963 RepID=A0A1R2B060_9CILI|nr:hypothetical protein SteCoe_31961 [Stentor coeruleus]
MKKQRWPLIVLGGLVTLAALKRIVTRRNLAHKRKMIEQAGQRRKRTVDVDIQMTIKLPEVPETKRQQILNSTILELQSGLDDKSFTCVEIFLSFTHELRTQSAKYNSIVDINVSYGLKRAEKLDLELTQGKKRSQLHGIPISVKDMIAVKNMLSSYGCGNLSQNIIDSDAMLVKILKKKGAVIYVKSSQSQNAQSYETVNIISGVTTHPKDCDRNAGGSSGGEAILMSTKGSCIGLGTDIGGSLRFPALSCGIYTLKPTSNRISRNGPLPLNDYPSLKNSWGPLSRSVDDLVVFCQEIFNTKPHASLPFVPWSQDDFSNDKPLTIGYCLGSSYWPIPECMKKAIHIAKNALENKGHVLVEFILDNEIKEANELGLPMYAYDAEDQARVFPELPLEHMWKMNKALETSPWLCWVYEKILRRFKGEKESFYYKYLSHNTCCDYIDSITQVKLFNKRFIEKVRQSGIDVLLFPYPFPAIRHNTSADLYPGFAYMSIFNLLDFPVGSVPICEIHDDEQKYDVDCKEIWAQAVKKTMQGSSGLFTGVQVAGMPFREEVVLRVMKDIEGR